MGYERIGYRTRMSERHYNKLDHLITQFDTGLRTVFGKPQLTARDNPAAAVTENELTQAGRDLAGRLMRINHAGEVAAQGLYQGQALTARLPDVREKMQTAAQEENDHLAWCESRINELGTHTSLLNPLWYGGSVAIGAFAGLLGDKWSLGFIVETERQVVRHLDSHLNSISSDDHKTRVILEQMKTDETHHATTALDAGGAALPAIVKSFMQFTSKIMTRSSYWI